METNHDKTLESQPATDAPTKPGPGFTVRDRRWWVDGSTRDNADAARERKPSYVEKLEGELEQARRAIEETRAKHRAALDELESAKARIERAAARELEQRSGDLVASFLPILDDIDRALASASGQDANSAAAIAEGVRLVQRSLLAKLRDLGVTPIEAEGAGFNPELHDAVAMVEVDEPERDGTVVAVHRPGYSLANRVLRPAMVAVGRAPTSGSN